MELHLLKMQLVLLKLIMAIVLSSRADVLKSSLVNSVHRNIRALSYPEESLMGLFFALAIPLDDPVSTKSISVAFFFEANYELPNNITEFQSSVENRHRDKRSAGQRHSINRKTIYAILESKFESLLTSESLAPPRAPMIRTINLTEYSGYNLRNSLTRLGFPGKQCLLRCICETARQPLHPHNGLVGDLMHITLTPSSTADEGLPIEYVRAEQVGFEGDCETIYSLCPFAIYDYITDAYNGE